MTDIKPPKTSKVRREVEAGKNIKTVSPVEEFSFLNTDDLRRESSIQSFVQKILEKINSLLAENYSNRARAIAYWQKSPLHKQYVEIGQKSLQQSKSVEEYLANKKDTLTYKEFEAIAELNQQLRF